MINEFDCPVCNSNNWYEIRKYSFSSTDYEPSGKYYENEYQLLRGKVFYEIWLEGKTQVDLKSQFCDKCGFVCYSPRPTHEEMTKKYEFLGLYENIGGQDKQSGRDIKSDQKRAYAIFKRIKRLSIVPNPNLLDVGGGNGKLLFPFIKNGTKCYIVDYNQNPLLEITWLATTLKTLETKEKFDIIICSHVLEHVVDPVEFLKDIIPFLKEKGMLYVEVPLEIWSGVPLGNAPVTHINFFSEGSLGNTLRIAGFNILKIKSTFGGYSGSKGLIVWGIVSKSQEKHSLYHINSQQTKNILFPGFLKILKRKLIVEPLAKRSLKPVFKLIKMILIKIFPGLKRKGYKPN